MQGFQRKHLRGLAHELQPVVQVGQAGLTEAIVGQTEAQLLAHELIKVRMHEPEDKKAMATELAERTGSELCGLIGHTAILYKRHPEHPRVVVPQRSRD